MQVGSFSEIYNKEIDLPGGPNLKDISDLLNCSIAMKGKNTENSHYMIGFPKISDSKYIPILIKGGYHVILIEQSTDGSSTHILNVKYLPLYLLELPWNMIITSIII